MCGIEILLCCAAGGAAGCCAKHKMDKNAKKKSSKGVKGDSEVYRKNGAKDAQRSKTSKKDAKGKAQELPKYRKSAYEEYQSRYAAKPETEATLNHGSDLHRRSTIPDSPKGGLMDAEEFDRLKAAQQREKLNTLRY